MRTQQTFISLCDRFLSARQRRNEEEYRCGQQSSCGHGNDPCRDNGHEVRAAHQLATTAFLWGMGRSGWHGDPCLFQAPFGVPLPEESNAKNAADGNMGRTDWQAQPAGYDHGDGGRQRNTIGTHWVELGDLATDHLDEFGAE